MEQTVIGGDQIGISASIILMPFSRDSIVPSLGWNAQPLAMPDENFDMGHIEQPSANVGQDQHITQPSWQPGPPADLSWQYVGSYCIIEFFFTCLKHLCSLYYLL